MIKSSVCLVALVAMGWVSVSSPLQAQDIARQIMALQAIRETANDICNKVKQSGKQDQAAISGDVNATIKGVIARFADLGIKGSGQLESEEYQGVVREQLATTLVRTADCERDVLKTLVDRMLPMAGPQPSLPASLKGKWTYESKTFDLLHTFKGTCFITQENGHLQIFGTRELTTEKENKKAAQKKYPWSSKVVAVSDQRLVMYYTITLDDGHPHDALVLINLVSEPITEMEGNFFQLAPGTLYGHIKFKKSQETQ